MDVRCANCHTAFSVDEGDEEAQCPTCKAEAGLEPAKAVPPAMRSFGLLLAAILVSALVGDILARIM